MTFCVSGVLWTVASLALSDSTKQKKQRISPLLLSGLVPSPRYFANIKTKSAAVRVKLLQWADRAVARRCADRG
jgi:hypothetical protein